MFIPSNMYLQSVPPPFVQQTVTGVPQVHLPALWGYTTTTDTIATVSASQYFNQFANFNQGLTSSAVNTPPLGVGDTINCVCSNGNTVLLVTSVVNGIVTAVSTIDPGSVNTAAIVNGAVTAAKIAAGTITTTQISASAGILGSQLATGTITSLELAASIPQVAYGTITSANFKTAYTAGLSLIPAYAPGTIIVPVYCTFTFNYLTAAYTAGGAIGLQWSTSAPVNAGGIAASATVAAANVTGLSAQGFQSVAGAMAINGASGLVDAGLWLTVATQNFASGSGTVDYNLMYYVILV